MKTTSIKLAYSEPETMVSMVETEGFICQSIFVATEVDELTTFEEDAIGF